LHGLFAGGDLSGWRVDIEAYVTSLLPAQVVAVLAEAGTPSLLDSCPDFQSVEMKDSAKAMPWVVTQVPLGGG